MKTRAVSNNTYFINTIQTYCISGRTIFLTGRFESGTGEFCLENGELIYAALSDLRAEEALYLALKERCGTLQIIENPLAPVRNINVGWRKLLVEGLARLNHESSNLSKLASPSVEINRNKAEPLSNGNEQTAKPIDETHVFQEIESKEQKNSEVKIKFLTAAKINYSLPNQKSEPIATSAIGQTNSNIIAFDSYRSSAHKESLQNSHIAEKEVSLPLLTDIVAALTQISEFATKYLGRTVVANYWRKAQKNEWSELVEITMNGKFELKKPLAAVTVDLWESACEWTNAFIKRCSVIVIDFPSEAQSLTGKALILTKPDNNYFEQSKDDLTENLKENPNEASAYRTARH